MYVEDNCFTTYKATCFDLNYRSSSGPLTFKFTNTTQLVNLTVRRPEDDAIIMVETCSLARTKAVVVDVHSVQQKSIGLKFSKSRTGRDVRYSFHHNSGRFTSPIFAHSCRFSVLHSLQSITPRIY